MDDASFVVMSFASRIGLRDVRIISREEMANGETVFQISGILSISDKSMSIENKKALDEFLDGPFNLSVRVQDGVVISHEWDKIQFS